MSDAVIVLLIVLIALGWGLFGYMWLEKCKVEARIKAMTAKWHATRARIKNEKPGKTLDEVADDYESAVSRILDG